MGPRWKMVPLDSELPIYGEGQEVTLTRVQVSVPGATPTRGRRVSSNYMEWRKRGKDLKDEGPYWKVWLMTGK